MALSFCFRRVLTLAIAVLTVGVVVNATQVMHRPDDYTEPPRKVATGNATAQVVYKRSTGNIQAAYFTNWGIYGANFQPTSINPAPLTHILYAFADTDASTGTISLTDSYADEQKHFPGDSWDETGNNLYGCLKQMYLLKLANRNLKVLLSIGGYTYSQDGHFAFLTDASARTTFVNSAVQMVQDYGFDGIDIDYEYADSDDTAEGFADLLTELRTAFDNLATQKGDSTPYQITVAVPAGSQNYVWLKFPQMDEAVSYWNLMAYDYAGSWLDYTASQDNLYGGQDTGVSTDSSIQYYIANGASADKINMGIPLYGRAFEDTTGIDAPYNGVGPGTTQAGIYSYNVLPIAGAQVIENLTDVYSYSYDSTKMELVSYDTPHIASLKAQYVQSKGLAGSMFWDLSTDKTGADSLVSTTAGVYGSLDQTQNHIDYPDSKWDNIRNNMGQSTGSSSSPSSPSSTPVSSPTSPTSTPTSSPTGTPGSGQCSGVSPWSPTATYVGGNEASYNGDLWTAKWWTNGDTPGGAAGVWTDDGAC